MSTRATVYVRGVQHDTVKLYHHCDGYVSRLGDNLIKYMNKCKGENVIENLFSIGGFEVDDISSNHTDVEYIYDIEVKSTIVEFMGRKRPMTSWKIEVRKGHGEEYIKQQQEVEIANGFDISDTNHKYMFDYDKVEKELDGLVK